MARSSGSFTSERARLSARKFWDTYTPEQIKQRNQKIQKLAYHKPEVMQEIKTLYNQGMNTCDIAKKFNVAKMTIIRAMHIANLQMRNPPARHNPNLAPNYTLGYVLGVIYGDGWTSIRKKSHAYDIGLNSIDREFVECFSFHLSRLLERELVPIRPVYCKTGERQTYYNTLCTSNKLGHFFKQLTYDQLTVFLVNPPFRIGFLRGFIDSEGSISLSKHRAKNKNQIAKRHPKRLAITISNTDKPLLEIVKNALEQENIATYRIYDQPMPNRWNKKPLYRLELKTRKWNIFMFIKKIGTRIKRKQNNIRIWKNIWL